MKHLLNVMKELGRVQAGNDARCSPRHQMRCVPSFVDLN